MIADIQAVRSWLRLWVVLVVVAGCMVGGAVGQQPGGTDAAPAAAEKPEFRVIPLKHVDAMEASTVLRELLGRKAEVSIAVDARTNSIVASGSAAALAVIENLLKKLDVEGAGRDTGKQELKVFSLKHAVTGELAEPLQLVYGVRGLVASFALDRARNLVIATGDRATLDAVEAMLKRLDEPRPERPAAEMQVRVVWLVSGLAREDAAKPPDDLKEVVTELAKLGIDKPKLVAQALVNASRDGAFQLEGQAKLEAACQLTITGQVQDKTDKAGLEISINAFQGGGRGAPERMCGLRTQITAPFGHAVVLGVTPTDAMTSVFVVQVHRK